MLTSDERVWGLCGWNAQRASQMQPTPKRSSLAAPCPNAPSKRKQLCPILGGPHALGIYLRYAGREGFQASVCSLDSIHAPPRILPVGNTTPNEDAHADTTPRLVSACGTRMESSEACAQCRAALHTACPVVVHDDWGTNSSHSLTA